MRYFVLMAGLAAVLMAASGAQAAGSLYEVENIAVDFTASDAVKAQQMAMADAQLQGAQIVIRRLVPLSAYGQIPQLSAAEVQGLVNGIAIGQERYSSTRYIASLGVSYNEQGVKQLLQSYGLPINEVRAPEIKVLPVLLNGGQVSDGAKEGWRSAWRGLDLSHSLTPGQVVAPQSALTAERLNEILSGSVDAYQHLESQYGKGPLVIAIAKLGTEDGAAPVLETQLFGADAAGQLNYSRKDRIFDGDVKAAAGQAAKISFGIIENRWKVTQGPEMASLPGEGMAGESGYEQGSESSRSGSGGRSGGFFSNLFGGGGKDESRREAEASSTADAASRNVVAQVQFSGLAGWQAIRSRLTGIPGIQRLEVSSLSPQGAWVSFDYAGSLRSLQQELAQNGFSFESGSSAFVIRSQ